MGKGVWINESIRGCYSDFTTLFCSLYVHLFHQYHFHPPSHYSNLIRSPLNLIPNERGADNRVRDHPRSNSRKLPNARISRRSTSNRQSLRNTRLRKRIRFRTPRIRCIPISTLWISSNGSSILIPFLPIPKTSLLGIYRYTMVGNNVPLPPLPHRFNRRSLFIRNGFLPIHAGGI